MVIPVDVRAALEEHHAEAFAWAMTCCRSDRGMAEDVLQNTYVKVLDGRARFDGRAAFRTWLFSVIRNTARDSWRSPWQRRQPLSSASEPMVARGDGELASEIAALDRAMTVLPARQAQVIALIYGHGLSVSECAAVLAISRGSAATHLHRAKQALRDQLIPETADA